MVSAGRSQLTVAQKKNNNKPEGRNKINFRMYSHTSNIKNLVENKLSFYTELKNRVSVRLGKIKKISLKKHFHFVILYLSTSN